MDCQLLFAELWENCNEDIKQLANETIIFEQMFDPTLNIEEPPKAVLLFEYTRDLDLLKEDYLEDHPEVKHIIVRQIQFLPECLSYLFEDKQLFTYNMFPIIIAF